MGKGRGSSGEAGRLSHWGLALLCVAAAPAWALDSPVAEDEAAQQRLGAAAPEVLSLRPRTSIRLSLDPHDWRMAAGDTRSHAGPKPEISLIELPPEPVVIGPPPRRAHHAISISLQAPKQLLRGIGLEATECATRFRLPSHLGKRANGSASVEVTAQIGLGCRF